MWPDDGGRHRQCAGARSMVNSRPSAAAAFRRVVSVALVRWTEFAARLGASLDNQEVPPCFRWFPQKSWPASMEPPPEGSLDEISLEALMPHLCAASPSDKCVAATGECWS